MLGSEAETEFEEGFRGESQGAVPAGIDLQGLAVHEGRARSVVVPEKVPCVVPAAAGGSLEEGVAAHAANGPDVVGGAVVAEIDPVHAADHIGVLSLALVDEFEDVFHAEGDVVDEDDGGVEFGEGRGVVEDGLKREVAESGEPNDAVADLGVDVAGGEEVGNTGFFESFP